MKITDLPDELICKLTADVKARCALNMTCRRMRKVQYDENDGIVHQVKLGKKYPSWVIQHYRGQYVEGVDYNQLTVLNLYNTKITSIDSLGPLCGSKLESLNLGNTDIASIDSLGPLCGSKLERLYLYDTEITSIDSLGSDHNCQICR